MVNFTKSTEIPLSLATEKLKGLNAKGEPKGSYSGEDVLRQLKTDFKNKCYLCEMKEPTSINVEHFIPHKNDINLYFDWNNLYWACVHCNNIKLDTYNTKPENMLLDCLNLQHKVCEAIHYQVVRGFPNEEFAFIALQTLPNNPEIVKTTAEFLDKVYNGHTHLKKIEGENMRKKVMKELNLFVETITNYHTETEDKDIYLLKIQRHLSKSSAFTAFKRWYILERENLKEEFEKYFD
jgi:uncharacterized protein (TIGR02646 family)